MLEQHDHVLDFVDDYLHDLLAPADAAYVEAHCEACRICKVALEEGRKRFAALETVPASEASGELIQATLQKIETHERERRRLKKSLAWGFCLATAASIAIIGGFHLYYLNLSPTPYDLTVLGQTGLLAGANGSLRVRLIHHENGAAVAGVPVDIELRDLVSGQLVQLAQFTTDDRGTGQPRFQLPDWADGNYELRVVARPRGTPEVLSERIALKRSWKLMLTSDKPVYQPGQTIHVRSLALRRPDLKPVAGREVMFEITDPKGNIIFKRRDTTSNYGIASIDCPLATEIIEGTYAIKCLVGNTDSKLTVDVKKYVLPKFKVSVELDQPYYQPGQRVHGKVHADYFFGKPVAGGQVEIEVRTTEIGTKVLQKLQARTNQAGGASFEFTLPETLAGIEQQSGDARIFLQVTLSDTAGQKQTKTVSRVVTASPLRVEVIPEGGALVRDLPNTIYLYASYADGRPARARLAVSGLEKEVVTNDLGVASFELTPQSAQVGLTIRATDRQGRIGRRHVDLTCGQSGSDFLIRTDKAVYNGADTVHLVALGGGTQPVFVDILKDDQTVLTETVDMTNGQGQFTFDLPPHLFGTVKLCAYRLSLAGLAVQKTRVLYIRPSRQLTIKTTLDHAEYRPGKQAKLQLALTDDRGKPTPGALSLTAVDEAVFSVLDQAPGMERTFYLLEQELLKPVYAIYPWSPDLTTSTPPQERNRFDQALFARTAQTEDVPSRAAQWVEEEPPQRMVPAGSPFTLSVSSFPSKSQQIEHDREVKLHGVWVAWTLLAVAVALALYAAVWIFLRPLWITMVVHATGFLALCLLALVFVAGVVLQAKKSPSLGVTISDVSQSMEGPPPKSAMMEEKAENPFGVIARAGLPGPIEWAGGNTEVAQPPVRVREWFPETLLWRPEVITDDQGHASLQVDLADSITTWRLSASAVAGDGRLGHAESPIRVFQPFFVDLNLPVALTRGDEVAIPVVVYNYLDKAQTVELSLENAGWFEGQDDATKRLDLAAGEVRSTSYRLRVTKVGNYELQVTARGSGVADALKRPIEVVPDGQRVEQVSNGTLQQPAEILLTVPPRAIDGSAKAFLKLYPSSFSQLVEGLDAIFQMPYGCFEQTSSTTYPNVLALDYLRRMHKSAPEVEAKARQYIHLGYQRLLGFEVAGGGFDWFGRPPANRTLTAYGLMEFQDMARVHDVDPQLIERTRQWLLKQRDADGSWPAEGHMLHEDPTQAGRDSDQVRLSTTAYIAWAVFSDPAARPQAQATLDYLLAHRPEQMNDPHVLALTCNALLAITPPGAEVAPYLRQLESLKRSSADGKLAWWEQAANGRTTFYGSGQSGSIETTALAALAMIHAGQYPGTTRAALTWLVQQKDASGTWHSTQATVLALKALLAGTGKPLGGDRERRIEITWDKGGKRVVTIAADQADVMQQIDLSAELGTGEHRLRLSDLSDTATGYQVAFRYHVPGDTRQERPEPLSIDVNYDRTDLPVGETVTATAKVVNQMRQTAPMVILDLPIPAGFVLESADLAEMVKAGSIAKYQANPRTVTVYLRGLEPGKPLQLRYRLRATMPVKVAVPSARVYEYYDTAKRGISLPSGLTATQQ